MDPLKELQQEYMSVKSSNNGSVLSEYLKVMLATTKEEIISFNGRTSNEKVKQPSKEDTIDEKGYYYETHTQELITIPIFLLPSIKEVLIRNTQVKKSTLTRLTSQAVKVFSVAENRDSGKTKPEDRKGSIGIRVKGSRKTKKQLSHQEERLALKKEKRVKLNLSDLPLVSSSNILVSNLEAGKLDNIRRTLLFTSQGFSSNEPSMKRIKAIRIADSLEEAEHRTRREDAIKNMITALKREDAESVKSSGIRLAGR